MVGGGGGETSYETRIRGKHRAKLVNKYICSICDCPLPSDDPAYAGCDAEECDVCNCAPCKKGQTCTKT